MGWYSPFFEAVKQINRLIKMLLFLRNTQSRLMNHFFKNNINGLQDINGIRMGSLLFRFDIIYNVLHDLKEIDIYPMAPPFLKQMIHSPVELTDGPICDFPVNGQNNGFQFIQISGSRGRRNNNF